MQAAGPGTGPWTQPRGPSCRGGWTRNWASSVARGQARGRRRRGEHEAMSSYRAVWGRGPSPGPSFLRVSSHSLVLAISLLDLACPCSSHDKRVVCRETCLVLDAIRLTLP